MVKFSGTFIALWLICFQVQAQTISAIFKNDWRLFNEDPQLTHAAVSICILNSKTGQLLFSQNKELGLAPASCNKTLTAASAFHYLGENFRYHTFLQYSGIISHGILHGNIIITGNGDPTLGSWRWDSTKPEVILQQWINAIRLAGIKAIDGSVIGNDTAFGTQIMPDGWIWQDMGNYYGAGGNALNWHENQFDIYLQPGRRIGDSARLVKIDGAPPGVVFVNELITGSVGSGDQAYAYLPPYSHIAYLRGTVPLDAAPDFSISAAVPDPGLYCAHALQQALMQNGITVQHGYTTYRKLQLHHDTLPTVSAMLAEEQSPTLNSITYWFLKRSINLYGELLAKRIARQEGESATTDNGVKWIHQYCIENGIDKTAVNTIDGSGLSPANRVTTLALATMLYKDQSQNWFGAFYDALPIIHDLHMKDGYINGVRSYTGFMTTRKGHQLIFAFIVNNFTGSPNTIRNKMWLLLDRMKEYL